MRRFPTNRFNFLLDCYVYTLKPDDIVVSKNGPGNVRKISMSETNIKLLEYIGHLTDNELYLLARTHGVVQLEDNAGFVTTEYYSTSRDFEQVWRSWKKHLED